MASFSITAYTYESVTLAISDLTTGGFVRIIVRLTDDVDDRTGDVTFTASSTSTTRTITGLSEETNYTVNVKHGAESDGSDAEWIGAQTFTTASSPSVINNKIVKLPVLDSSYALFDWAAWPASYAALYSGGQTSAFEKECWNAIVNKVAQAFTDSGLTWDSKYASASGSKITQALGALTADAFNSVAQNINFPVPLGWAWAKRPAFRGYVGREAFRGVEDYGSNADDVYPEYIIELARRLNVFLRVLKDEITVSASGRGRSASQHSAVAYARPSLVLPGTQEIITSLYSATARTGYGARVQSAEESASRYETAITAHYAARVTGKQRSLTASDLTVDKLPSAPIGAAVKSTSLHSALILSGIPIELLLMEISTTTPRVTIRAEASVPIQGAAISASIGEMNLTQDEPIPIQVGEASYSLGSLNLTQDEPVVVSMGEQSAALDSATIRGATGAQIRSDEQSATVSSCKLSTAWYPPIWVDGGLWIRQSHGVTQNDNGELVIT